MSNQNKCGCEYGEDCTKTTVCDSNESLEHAQTEIKLLESEILNKGEWIDELQKEHGDMNVQNVEDEKRIEQLQIQNKRLAKQLADVVSYEGAAQRKRINQLESMLKTAKCPNADCIQGVCSVGPDGGPSECRWCYEQSQLIGGNNE